MNKKKFLIINIFLIFLLSFTACTSSEINSDYSSDSDIGTVYVKGYYRKDGTYVKPHTRTSPDGIKTNNKSYKKKYK